MLYHLITVALTLLVCLRCVCMCSAYFLANMLLEVVLASINGVLFGTMSYLMLVRAPRRALLSQPSATRKL